MPKIIPEGVHQPALTWLSEAYLIHLVSLHRRPVYRHENGDIALDRHSIATFVDGYFEERRSSVSRRDLYLRLLHLKEPDKGDYLAYWGEPPRLTPRGIRLINAMFQRFGLMAEEMGGYEELVKLHSEEVAGG
ncbi:hypothetical protein ICL29_004077 [Salmonella enterica]|nr:hypothetical protein [Salmonella enterica]EHK5999353.1 hypothetical protein [Salmonella enterica]EIF5124572.1 hypothetical protein [Salmonella enterica]EIF5348748.1 hypothetical protein [Salmonella enterica]EIF5657345.1 hypothetical protein [Salmonella enterica]